jgi:hypothetical protein
MHRILAVIASFAAFTVVIAGAADPYGVSAQDASPAAEEMGPPPGVADVTLAFGMVDALPATPALIFMDRLTIDPGTSIPGEPGDPTFAFVLVESGALTVQADAPLAVGRAAALADALATPGTMPETEEVAAGTAVTLAVGDAIVFPPAVGVELRNDGSEPVVVLGTAIMPVG